jgi:hypothetical protein
MVTSDRALFSHGQDDLHLGFGSFASISRCSKDCFETLH